MSIKIVCATDDGTNFSKKHFGSAQKYQFYSLDPENGKIWFIKEIENLTPAEKAHGDPDKANAVSEVLNEAQVLVNLVFGPNIVRMRKRFVTITSTEKNIQRWLNGIKGVQGLQKLTRDWQRVS